MTLVIGIVGGIASGKSAASKAFEKLGAIVIDADAVGHEVLAQSQTKQQIRDAWGDRVFDESGNVVRKKIAEIVFTQDSNALKLLEQITHPKIEARLRQLIDETPDSVPALVLDAPILLKAGWDQYCHKVVFVECDRANRWLRAQARGWSEQMFDARESAQFPVSAKRNRSTDSVSNNGTIEELQQAIADLWIQWDLPVPNPAENSDAPKTF